MADYVRSERAHADQVAAQFQADDPLFPFMPVGAEQRWVDWMDFARSVCVPLVEADEDEAAEQAAMAEYRKASPYFIAAALVLALRRAEAVES